MTDDLPADKWIG
jgi:hypothetical protein